ncbi:MAG: phosphoribosylglycinamide synthetase C domain-containing protein [Candidatus Moraniibacteriota bacterium]
MRVLFVSRDLSGGDLCYRLKQEGHDVKLFIRDKDQQQNLEGMVTKVSDWKKELKWVGKNGLIVFDSTGYGREQDKLRAGGYSVVGGCALGDKLEDNRAFGEKILSECGIATIPSKSFYSLDEAIAFVKKNRGEWVVKQNGHVSKIFNYVGHMADGSDVIEILKSYRKYNKKDASSIQLQRRKYGVEIGVARYFNGHDWVGPIEMNVEYKSLCAGGLGPKTDEMGTLMWYDDNEDNVLFQRTLAKLKNYLQEIGFHGDFDINCIVDKDGIYPLEATARFGSPSTQLQASLHVSPWGEFLKAVADGKSYNLKYKRGFGVIVLLATPPFPYTAISQRYSVRGSGVFFKEQLTKDELSRIHIEELSTNKQGNLYISGKRGFILDVSGVGKTVEAAQKQAYSLAEKIVIPKKFYRTDIGEKFLKQERALLEKWGYLKRKH